jgi:hypothetical protein
MAGGGLASELLDTVFPHPDGLGSAARLARWISGM